MVAISGMATENKRVPNKRAVDSMQTRALFHFFQMSKLQSLVREDLLFKSEGHTSVGIVLSTAV